MSSQTDLARFTIEQFAERFRQEMIPLGNRFSYFFIALPFGEEDVKEYLEEPIAALPPTLLGLLPKLSVCLVPYLERVNGKDSNRIVTLAKPAEQKQALSARLAGKDDTMLVFAVEGREVADYHYRFYRALAEMIADELADETFNRIARRIAAATFLAVAAILAWSYPLGRRRHAKIVVQLEARRKAQQLP